MEKIAEKQLQKRVLSLMVTDPKFFNRVKDTKADLFAGDKVYNDLLSTVKEFRKKYPREVPTKDTLDTLVQEKLDRKRVEANERTPYAEAIEEVYQVSDKDIELTQTKVLDYLRKRMMYAELEKVAVNELSPQSLEVFDKAYEKIKQSTSSATQSTVIDVFDLENTEEIVQSIEDVTGNVMSTGSPFYDSLTGGGLARGELGALASPSGFGKTQNMVSLSASYMFSGKDVMFIALEEKRGRMVLRIAKAVLGRINSERKDIIPDEQLDKLTFNDEIENLIKTGRYHKMIEVYEERTGNKVGKFIFSHYPPHTISIDDLYQIISDTTVTEGLNLDVLVVDYPDLIKAPNMVDNEAIVGGLIYEQIRALTQEFNVVGWVASQVNRGAANADTINRNSLEGSFRKINAVEFFGFVQKSSVEFENSLTRIYVDKSRNGQADRMVHGKVGKYSKYVELETPEEIERHEELLNGNKEGVPEYVKNLAENAGVVNPPTDFSLRVNKTLGK